MDASSTNVGTSERTITTTTTTTTSTTGTFDISVSMDQLLPLPPHLIPSPVINEHGIDFVDCILEERWPEVTNEQVEVKQVRQQPKQRVLHRCTVAGCTRSFPLKSNLKKHRESVHLKLRPHACPRCNRTFYERCKLRGHVATVHDGQRRFPCQHPGCAAAFKQNSDRKRHVREVHHGASRW